ncbi:MAG TPA: hypothetical protein VMW76_00075 [Bacteroidales bacterium]|nr:hypothetical protein [Bacteroidales bacterium]
MKRLILSLIWITVVSLSCLYSQGLRNNKIDAEKIAFFTKRLELSPQEAEKFWPVYNDYTSRKEKLALDKNSLLRYLNQNYKNLTEDELEESSDKFVNFNLQEAELAKEYHDKFKQVLPPSKVVRLYNAEVQFKALLLNQLGNRREQRPVRRRF